MAFSFGSSSAPAPGGGFSFSSSTPAPGPAFGGFGTTATTPTPAPGGGFGFGSSPGPAPAASAPGSFTFGNNAPVSAFGTGGGAPAPAPLFGTASSTPGTSAFGFGSSSTMPSSSSPFSLSTAPISSSGTFGTSMFGSMSQQQQHMNQQSIIPQPPSVTISGNMLYSDLSPQMKQAFDNIHQAIMRHKRSMMNLQSMAPKMLLPEAGVSVANMESSRKPKIINDLSVLDTQLNRLQSDIERLSVRARQQNDADSELARQSIMYAKWPVEAVAHRKGIRLTPHPTLGDSQEEKKDDNINNAATLDIQARLRESLDRAMATVDRIEKMPSPFMWQLIHDLDKRLNLLDQKCTKLVQEIDQSSLLEQDLQLYDNPLERVSQIVEFHHQALRQLTSKIDIVRGEMERLRYRYRHFERGENVLDKAAAEVVTKQRKLNEAIQLQMMHAPQLSETTTATTSTPTSTFPTSTTPTGSTLAPAPTSSFSFTGLGTTPAPAPTSSGSGFSFNTTPAPAPTSTGSFSFNSAAPATGAGPAPSLSSFGQPAPAPALTGFGTATTAPAFGFTSAAPAASTPSAKKKTTRSGGRLKR